ncbi:hypothetical protein PENTCL1PPCAC_612, partial [Pristionchus entomophagus]
AMCKMNRFPASEEGDVRRMELSEDSEFIIERGGFIDVTTLGCKETWKKTRKLVFEASTIANVSLINMRDITITERIFVVDYSQLTACEFSKRKQKWEAIVME